MVRILFIVILLFQFNISNSFSKNNIMYEISNENLNKFKSIKEDIWSVSKKLDKRKERKNSKIKEGQNVKENVHKGI